MFYLINNYGQLVSFLEVLIYDYWYLISFTDCPAMKRMEHENTWATPWKNLFMPYANNKGADQPAHSRSLISAFIVHCLDSIIPLVSIYEISSLYLASVATQAGLCLTWSQTPEDTGFLVMRLTCIRIEIDIISIPELGDTIGSLFGSSDKADDSKVETGTEKTEVYQITDWCWMFLKYWIVVN